jgi:hypothetical protein
MRDSKRMPENYISIDKIGVGVCSNPKWDTLGGITGGLGDVAAGGVDL